jgi:hypothetical protein
LSAAKSVPSGANVNGPTELRVGPWPVTATARADEGDMEAETRNAMRSKSFTDKDRMMNASPFVQKTYAVWEMAVNQKAR